ncbi:MULTISPECIES: tRNA (guanosine(46)-N7)-methyltransferase TrmB [unclassified Romboutsia]|uniref:tRNA (guanosine(46)-N7)-methyltransferase TrmB n=1 Tax=unclassified Romboutsia TaxID=2626894 RepID=UPI001898729B|nr:MULTISPECIES: tRNA (guanosine(46)-N7)-methyltransferase TrmB [unclassified Romboutsia]MDB8804949.1 tRNA (guanosine(46)-N7)-methyltransferase TrmB [Romboutsia sp. 1001216sp1]MDB8808581.1 tRNA (guanosine(46)-N7)-methyltransferase TrmB [Romboutsia sp. 1001216sp1]MDB8810594.1 tRNA (guanosine(46)-N7)-methyltransferase TrmB [Romboutsia sp. 1001216sp1]MDB8816314.1 tRNA (guanosine(46)-N7)-methyltransferase TrmB [Romboutsia sp. 1001216sp1]MDB8818733.1 tRNA (guanosine(46)-N7)-methyltransferase TrmB [
MRRRKVKGADIKLLSYENYVLKDNIEQFKGKWNKRFENNNPIHVEFGTGRGKFLTTLAKENPNINYIAFEIKEEVLLKAVEKAIENNLDNILFAWANAANILDYFEKEELSRIYINFCDPWPKKRWAKRRLTHKNFLNMYNEILNDDGEIHFKTDNENLFEFSLNEITDNNWKLKNISLDLANSEFENVTTEYEDKFMSYGMKIFRCEARKK